MQCEDCWFWSEQYHVGWSFSENMLWKPKLCFPELWYLWNNLRQWNKSVRFFNWMLFVFKVTVEFPRLINSSIFIGYIWEIVCWTWGRCMELCGYLVCASLWHPSFWWWKHTFLSKNTHHISFSSNKKCNCIPWGLNSTTSGSHFTVIIQNYPT